jgi:peptidoglycan/xylan/chitin deacetylase (PgdA/CDA1 family)
VSQSVATVLARWLGTSEQAVLERVRPEELASLSPGLVPGTPSPSVRLLRRAAGTLLPKVPHGLKRAATGTAKRLRETVVAPSSGPPSLGSLPLVELARRLARELGVTAPGPGRTEISHDVDWPTCYRFVEPLAELEKKKGIRSTFLFLLGDGYTVDRTLLDGLRRDGFGVGIHGWTHDVGIGYRSDQEVRDHLARAREAIGFEARLYRAPGLGVSPRLLEILDELGFEADGSLCLIGRRPQDRTTGTPFPYLIPGCRNLREHPLGLQDDRFFRDQRLSDEAAFAVVAPLVAETVALGGSFVWNGHPTLVQEHLPFFERLVDHAKTLGPVVPFGTPPGTASAKASAP